MNKDQLLLWLRERFEDNLDIGGETWWLKELAMELEIPSAELFDPDQDTGLLFQLKEDGKLTMSLCERLKDEFDYLIWLDAPKISWDN